MANPLAELREMLELQREMIELQKEAIEFQKETAQLLRRILHHFHHFTIEIKETSMALGLLSSPGTAALLLALLDNGVPYVAPENSDYKFVPSLVASDPDVAITADPDTPNQFDVTIPAGDISLGVIFTAQATAPDGSIATGTLTISFAPQPQQFTIKITQTA